MDPHMDPTELLLPDYMIPTLKDYGVRKDRAFDYMGLWYLPLERLVQEVIWYGEWIAESQAGPRIVSVYKGRISQ